MRKNKIIMVCLIITNLLFLNGCHDTNNSEQCEDKCTLDYLEYETT